jgi:hypothetical protein
MTTVRQAKARNAARAQRRQALPPFGPAVSPLSANDAVSDGRFAVVLRFLWDRGNCSSDGDSRSLYGQESTLFCVDVRMRESILYLLKCSAAPSRFYGTFVRGITIK